MATEVNRQISLPSNPDYEIIKAHVLPKRLYKEENTAPRRIVYIYRDFRDILISSFFYFKFKGDESEVRLVGLSRLIMWFFLKGPRKVIRYLRNRVRLLDYVKSLCINGDEQLRKIIDTWKWSEHINEWVKEANSRPELRIAFISYEELLDDTGPVILRTMQKLDIPEPDRESIERAIERQSFAGLKQHFKDLPEDAQVPFGKEFNIRFHRKGISGDWKNFLSRNMGKIIQEQYGEMLLQQGYEFDPDWYKRAKNCTAEMILGQIKGILRRYQNIMNLTERGMKGTKILL